jgi:hypothetical protein
MISIQYTNGCVLHGVVLAIGDRMVRVAVRGSDDASEFRLIGQVWVSEDCEVVKIVLVDRFPPVEAERACLLRALFPFREAGGGCRSC